MGCVNRNRIYHNDFQEKKQIKIYITPHTLSKI